MNLTTEVPTHMSPITLNEEWSRATRLLVLVLFSTIGCSGNVMLISSITIDFYLKRAGNSLIASMALADLLVGGAVFPASAVILLANAQPPQSMCRIQWFVAVFNFFVCVSSSMLMALENYWRFHNRNESIVIGTRHTNVTICNPNDTKATPQRTCALLTTVWLMALVISAVQITEKIGFDYCQRKSDGLLPYQIVLMVLLIILPMVLTIVFHIKSICSVRSMMNKKEFRRSLTLFGDYDLVKTNLCCFITFLLFWTPFAIVLITGSRNVSDTLYYNMVWLGMTKSCISPYMYCLVNRRFRICFVKLFKYCCCKDGTAVGGNQRTNIKVKMSPRYPCTFRPQCQSTAHQTTLS